MFPAPKLVFLCLACAAASVVLPPHSASAQSTLPLQARCATQAHKAFQEDTDIFDPERRDYKASYKNHYNVKLKRCFILESWRREQILFDADKRAYAESSTTGLCKLTPPNEQEKNCKSRKDFDAFVAKYMND
jgi:hypothetical protein